MRPLDIRHIGVRAGALDLEVAAALETLQVDGRVAGRVLDVLPNLARHVCVSGGKERFGDELVGTELPHLLEHVAIELLGQASRAVGCSDQALVGHTSWLEPLAETRAQGVALMRVTIACNNDFTGLRACEMARSVVEWSVSYSHDEPGVAGYVAELQGMMERL